MPTNFMALFATLNSSGVPFVIVGGLASILHGVDRTTADVDIVLDLAAASVAGAIAALTDAGYRPMAPVNPADFADPMIRAEWQRDRGMKVFCMWDPENRRPTIDILVESVVPFEALSRDAIAITFHGTTLKVAAIHHLIDLKKHAGRPQDLSDIARLRKISGLEGSDERA
jgi:hypothetical protein